VWAFATGDPVDANPIVVDGTAYVGSSDGHLYAVDVATGQLAWRYAAPEVSAAPTYTMGLVCVAGVTGNFYAINGRTGLLAWQRTTSAAPELTRSWAVDADLAKVIMPADGALQVYDAANGATSATFTTQAGYSGTVTAADNTVYVLDLAGALRAISVAPGGNAWSTALLQGDTAGTGLVIAGDTIYLGTTAGTLYSVNTTTGQANWSYPAGHGLRSDPVIMYGNVYFTDVSGLLHAITAPEAKQVWTYSTGGSGSAGPAVAGGQVYACTSHGLQSLDADSGQPGWTFTPPGSASFVSTPTVVDGIIYVGCQDHNLYAILA
jgi:eukaryotic-like serine/threonine-protein kinase